MYISTNVGPIELRSLIAIRSAAFFYLIKIRSCSCVRICNCRVILTMANSNNNNNNQQYLKTIPEPKLVERLPMCNKYINSCIVSRILTYNKVLALLDGMNTCRPLSFDCSMACSDTSVGGGWITTEGHTRTTGSRRLALSRRGFTKRGVPPWRVDTYLRRQSR